MNGDSTEGVQARSVGGTLRRPTHRLEPDPWGCQRGIRRKPLSLERSQDPAHGEQALSATDSPLQEKKRAWFKNNRARVTASCDLHRRVLMRDLSSHRCSASDGIGHLVNGQSESGGAMRFFLAQAEWERVGEAAQG